MSARKADPRGPIAVVECRSAGPNVWFPFGFGRTPAAREFDALASAASSRVFRQHRGQWVPV